MITLAPQSVVANTLVTIAVPGKQLCGSLVIANESNLAIKVQVSPSSPFNVWIPAWVVDRIDVANYQGFNGSINVLPQALVTGIPVPSNSLLITVYFVGEPISPVYPYCLARVTQ